MLTTETKIQESLCPYTGLRSFTEDESLYFKGRDQQVTQIISLLEKNKFLMVTGASGEGKSSVIFAGLIPCARAGFFKAKFTNWIVADFRPERNPLGNMARSIAEKFNYSAGTVETELRRGFSALADLFTSSDFYVDEATAGWQALPTAEQRARRRASANLLILVDQFEEFFTNPENFHKKSPTQDAQTVVNLLLETARIALKRDLPIYVVCTMRSDYIGQCVAFRGLAEYIGFSQFFVPRLKRKDLKQVIEQPAILNGNQISQRLIERLVFDLADGVDQLPILQHAMSQIWHAAREGQDEMDLLHYAMVGGMPPHELEASDHDRFSEWFMKLPAYRQALYSNTGLNHVIEIHANILYESAYDRYQERYADPSVDKADVKRIIALAFACLTKVDNGRAVRNRMTLAEITSIINRSHLTSLVVARVLEPYREQHNACVRPFLLEGDRTPMPEDTVLEITHESLIRNWGRLNKWVSQEFAFLTSYLDFKKQLTRWKESGKKSSYLLPIGPLSFFENWYEQCKPNAGWINRYEWKQNNDQDTGAQILRDSKEFLTRSARRVAVTRAFVRYGSERIAAGLAIVVMLAFSAYYWYDAVQKQNGKVRDRIRAKGDRNFASGIFVGDDEKAHYVFARERLKAGDGMTLLSSLEAGRARIQLAVQAYQRLVSLDNDFAGPFKAHLIDFVRNELATPLTPETTAIFLVEQKIKFLLILGYDRYYNPDQNLDLIANKEARSLHQLCKSILADPKLYSPSVASRIHLGMQLWLTYASPTKAEIEETLNFISVFRGGRETFLRFFPKGSSEPNGIRAISYNGGYHMLASLYAAAGDTDHVLRCLDMMRDQPDYFSGRSFNNVTNVIGYFYAYGFRSKLPLVVDAACKISGRTQASLYDELNMRTAYLPQIYRANFNFVQSVGQGNFHPNLCFINDDARKNIAEDFRTMANKISDADVRNYLLAIHYKQQGQFLSKYAFDRGKKTNSDSLFLAALAHFRLVSPSYLSGRESIMFPMWLGYRTQSFSRRSLFVYPDYIGGWLTSPYHSEQFYNFIRQQKLEDEFYKSDEDAAMINFWLPHALERRPWHEFEELANRSPVSDAVLLNILNFFEGRPRFRFDKNYSLLILANRSFARGDTAMALRLASDVELSRMSQWTSLYEPAHNSNVLNEVKYLGGNFAKFGLHNRALALARSFDSNDEQVFAYSHAATEAYRAGHYTSGLILLDSALTVSKKIPPIDIPDFRDFRFELIGLCAFIGGNDASGVIDNLMENLTEQRRFVGSLVNALGSTLAGNLYMAERAMPTTFTEQQELNVINIIHHMDAINLHDEFRHMLNDWQQYNYTGYRNITLN